MSATRTSTPLSPGSLTALPRAARLAAARRLALRNRAEDPALILSGAGLSPDPWQADFLRARHPRTLLACARSTGKSTAAAARCVAEAVTVPDALVLIVSPTERQSGELALKAFALYDALGFLAPPARKRTELQLHLANGSRLLALPDNEAGVRGYNGVTLLVIDEASRVPDDLYRAVRPMLSVRRGHLVCLSTPFGRRGWFWEEWNAPGWRRHRVTAWECPRVPRDFLAEERAKLGERWFRQEHECSFEAAEGQAFQQEAIDRAFAAPDVAPLFGGVACS
jgi:hypothetical protein